MAVPNTDALNRLLIVLGAHNRMVETYAKESDRAAAILAASHFEFLLGEALRAVLVDDPKFVDEVLLGSDGPLATFSRKVHSAYALGLVTRAQCRDLNLIRKIRNHFAHHPQATSFGDSPVREMCGELLNDCKPGLPEGQSARERYLVAVAVRSVDLVGRVGKVPRATVPER